MIPKKNFLIITDTFFPENTSGAIQLYDLARELIRQGNRITVFTPFSSFKRRSLIENIDGIEVVKLFSPNIRSVKGSLRFLFEASMPFFMLNELRNIKFDLQNFDGIIWYAPSIFHTPLVKRIKKISKCPTYLIIRDIFPQWLLDVGILKNGIIFRLLKYFESLQNTTPDFIGVQSSGNLDYFADLSKNKSQPVIEVLPNWLSPLDTFPDLFDYEKRFFKNRKVFIYAGNMGEAQSGLEVFLDVANRLKYNKKIGFLFIGRGTKTDSLKKKLDKLNLKNFLIKEEIKNYDLPGLLHKCYAGLICLDPLHKTHNIPGKFLTYLRSGLPVFGVVNSNNDLNTIVKKNRLGNLVNDLNVEDLQKALEYFNLSEACYSDLQRRCKSFYQNNYTTNKVASFLSKRISSKIN